MGNVADGFVSILCGIIFILAATVMLVFPPKKINDLYGYRSNNSRKSQERWDFAQRFSAWRMLEVGVFMLAVAVILDYADLPEIVGVVVGLPLIIGSCIYLFVRTESAIKKKFPL
ncbi:SdpI family protein [Flavobacterium sp.]|uniref:SdpI family protein n=1 Tax=Flavobacterium sp. TaxID=239 RepID=UPI00120C60B9|nr:SdpI family protein [Flavobacterium sp.]RZJ71954.1 MAG: SdpI family protein [Flavobacterium sp.]